MLMAQKNYVYVWHKKNANGTGTSLATRRFDGDNGQPEKKQVCFVLYWYYIFIILVISIKWWFVIIITSTHHDHHFYCNHHQDQHDH